MDEMQEGGSIETDAGHIFTSHGDQAMMCADSWKARLWRERCKHSVTPWWYPNIDMAAGRIKDEVTVAPLHDVPIAVRHNNLRWLLAPADPTRIALVTDPDIEACETHWRPPRS